MGTGSMGSFKSKRRLSLLTITNVTIKEIRELHRNMLFPLRLVDPEGPQEDNTTTQVKANK